ncbi:hypothetical protein TNCV_3684571 [Trichonephila clavipes]|uniref:Uncharacterized protein n=1 Tax=Trichonephila clavipes TaxID=2585209 RepID=A0A8X6RIV0_TRICX|nr:hypothetical protein TNCV_3684571 [Trichonephila clavipes]
MFIREENPQESLREIVRKVSELTGVSKRTVFRLKKILSAFSSAEKRPGAVGQREINSTTSHRRAFCEKNPWLFP